jgi:hypothetical protein
MTDWYDPGAWEHAAKATATILDALKKLRDTLSRRKPTHAGGAESVDAVDEQITALSNALREVLGLMMQAHQNEGRGMNALFEIAKTHESRLTALEHAPKDRGTRVTKQKRRRVPKQKRGHQ